MFPTAPTWVAGRVPRRAERSKKCLCQKRSARQCVIRTNPGEVQDRGAARAWWLGVDEDAEPSWHPLIYDSTGIYGDDVIARLAHEFEAVRNHDAIAHS